MNFEMNTDKDKENITSIEGEIGIVIDLEELKIKGFNFNDSVFYEAADNMGFIKLLDREEFNTGIMKYINGEDRTKNSITINNKYYCETIKIDIEKNTLYWIYSFNRTI